MLIQSTFTRRTIFPRSMDEKVLKFFNEIKNFLRNWLRKFTIFSTIRLWKLQNFYGIIWLNLRLCGNICDIFSMIVCRNSWFLIALGCRNSWFCSRSFSEISDFFSEQFPKFAVSFHVRLPKLAIFHRSLKEIRYFISQLFDETFI